MTKFSEIGDDADRIAVERFDQASRHCEDMEAAIRVPVLFTGIKQGD